MKATVSGFALYCLLPGVLTAPDVEFSTLTPYPGPTESSSNPIGCLLSDTGKLFSQLTSTIPSVGSELTDLSEKIGSIEAQLAAVSSTGDIAQIITPTFINAVNGVAEDATKLSQTILDLVAKIDWSCLGNDQIQQVISQINDIISAINQYTEDVEAVVNDLSNINVPQGAFDLLKDLYPFVQQLLGALKGVESHVPFIGSLLSGTISKVEDLNTAIHDCLEKIPF